MRFKYDMINVSYPVSISWSSGECSGSPGLKTAPGYTYWSHE